MATKPTILKNQLKDKYLEKLSEYLSNEGEDVLRVGSGAIAFPVVDEDGNDEFIKIVISVPSGERNGEPYDGYDEAKDYEFKVKEKAEKQAESKAKAEAKKKRDAETRAAKAAAKERREKEGA